MRLSPETQNSSLDLEFIKMKTYFRVRMIFNDWYLRFYDAEGKELYLDMIGPLSSHKEASDMGINSGLMDMDKSDLPVGD